MKKRSDEMHKNNTGTQDQNRLRLSEERFRILADQSSDVIVLVNREGVITYENQAVEKALGFNAKERLGGKGFERIHPDDLKFVVNEFNRLFSDIKARISQTEVRLRHKDGNWRTFEAVASNLVHDNVIETVIVNLRDITERKRAEEAIKQSEEKYRLLADHMKDQVWLMDLDLKMTYISPSVEKVLGYNLEELTQLPLDKLLTSESFKAAMDFFSIEMPKALAAPSDYILNRSLELEFRCKDGHTVWGETKFSFIRDENGNPLSMLGEGRDITERKRAEDKLQQTLESLKRAVGTTIQVLMSALESRDPYTSGHQSRVAHLACAIATEMGLSQEKIEGIRMAGSIHDIGKLSIPAEILTKPTKLTDLEFSLIKVHSQTGYDMLKDVESPWPLAQIVYQHHERMNGSGYPQNIKGDEIILEARIMAVADVVEAMASNRPYRASLGIDVALEEIKKNKGILYDEYVADACLKLFTEKSYQLI
jgi:PAS domain S-box-containing protein